MTDILREETTQNIYALFGIRVFLASSETI